MKVIIGLRNPGAQYANTRHNAGQLFLNHLIQKLPIKQTHKSARYTLHAVNQSLCLCLPQTYMNQSGKALQALKRKHPTLTPKDILVVHDDLEHKVGNVRIKEGGSAQGHNGVEDIWRELRTGQFKRLQIGIGRPESREPEIVARYVLGKFGKDQIDKIKANFDKGIQLLKQHQFL